MRQLPKQFERRTLLLTGHSLGAGTAIVAGWLLRESFPALRVVAYEPPPCLDEAAADDPWVRERVLSVVNRDDIVPRMSMACAARLAENIDTRRAGPSDRRRSQSPTMAN